jgi:FtsH-binding integral membrane protein
LGLAGFELTQRQRKNLSNDLEAQDQETSRLNPSASDSSTWESSPSPNLMQNSIKAGFIRKVYGLLSAQMAFTVFFCGLCMGSPSLQGFMLFHSTAIFYTAEIGMLISVCAVMICKKRYPHNLISLGVFTLFTSLLLGIVCASYAAAGVGYLVVEALAITMALFVGISAYAHTSGKDFSWMGAYLYGGLCLLIVWSFIAFLVGFQTGDLYAIIGSLLFCGYILYDTSNILHRYSPDDAVVAALELYLDIVNLFLYLLDLLTSNRN